RNVERIDLDGTLPLAGRGGGGSENDRSELDGTVRLGDRHRIASYLRDDILGEDVTRGESPCPVGQRADAEAECVAVVRALQPILARADALRASGRDANVGVGCAGGAGRIEGDLCQLPIGRIADGGASR